MSEWKAQMPRATPTPGKTSVVFAVKTCRGTRLEIVGDMNERHVLAAWNVAQLSTEDFQKLEPKLVELGLLKTASEASK